MDDSLCKNCKKYGFTKTYRVYAFILTLKTGHSDIIIKSETIYNKR